MKIIVTGLESSGTKWMTQMLSKHPDVTEVAHTSIPEYLMIHPIKTRWPDLTGADFVVWMLRYEPFRLKSILTLDYDAGRDLEFLPPNLYEHCRRLFLGAGCPIVMVSYEGLIGPIGQLVFENACAQMGLIPDKMPEGFFVSKDANEKYVVGG